VDWNVGLVHVESTFAALKGDTRLSESLRLRLRVLIG
jgi:hypothetical protein